MTSDKRLLRNRLKASRQAIPPQKAAELSNHITGKLLKNFDWPELHSLHVYQPLLRHQEIDTRPFIKDLRTTYPHLKIATWEDLFGAPIALWLAPDTGKPPARGFQFDLIIVPMLGFNDQCHRIGFGGGFYDRFLATQGRSVTVGLCYEAGHADFEAEAHDMQLEYVITERAVYSRPAAAATK